MATTLTNTKTLSLWQATTTDKMSYPSLKGRHDCDVAIVGGGITGLTAALLLKRSGKRVILVEKGAIFSGETGHTTAHITEIIDSRYYQLISDFGKKDAKLVSESSRSAIHQIETFIGELGINCDFKRVPAFLYAENKKQARELKKEFEATQTIGLIGTFVKNRARIGLPFDVNAAAEWGLQAQFNPGIYCAELAKAIEGDGSFVFERTKVTDVQDNKPCLVQTENGSIVAEQVIVATDSPISTRFGIHTKVAAYRTYALAATLKSGMPPVGLYWDMADPYHYIRTANINGQEYLVVGGEDHKVGMDSNTQERFQKLIEYTQSRFDVAEITHTWSGQVLEPVDGLPFIGLNPNSKNIYISAGYAGNGMTFGTIGGMLLSDLVMERKNEWAKLYDSLRFRPLASAKDFLWENKDYAYCMVKDRITPTEKSASLSEVKPGEGKIVEFKGEKVAVYHDEAGAIRACSAVCPHMGCLVRFNNAEKTWDCPCHGSQFDTSGTVLHGPARSDLTPVLVGKARGKTKQPTRRRVAVKRKRERPAA